MRQTDSDLLFRLKQGDKAAFRMVYNTHWSAVYAVAYRLLGDHTQCEDLVQELFIELWHKRTALQVQSLLPYLLSSVRNNAYRLIARGKASDSFYKTLYVLNSRGEHADSSLISKELLAAYQSLLRKMPAQRKRIFQMRFEEELSTSVIAQRLQISQKTVQNHLLQSTSDVKSLLNF